MDLTIVEQNNQLLVDSREVAELVGKRHADLLRSIKSYVDILGDNQVPEYNLFLESSYKDRKGENRKYYLLTKQGCEMIVDRMRNSSVKKQIFIKFINEKFNEKIRTIVINSRFEESFMDNLEKALKVNGLDLERQKQVLTYRLDGYIPKLNIAIEYDEASHFTMSNKNKDIRRQKEVERELSCVFVRCNYQKNNHYNIGLVFKKIMEVSNVRLSVMEQNEQ